MIDFERKFLDRSIRLSAECLERSFRRNRILRYEVCFSLILTQIWRY